MTLSLESNCNVLYECVCFSKESFNFFADMTKFSAVSGNCHVIRRGLIPFDNIPKIVSRIGPHALTKFGSD